MMMDLVYPFNNIPRRLGVQHNDQPPGAAFSSLDWMALLVNRNKFLRFGDANRSITFETKILFEIEPTDQSHFLKWKPLHSDHILFHKRHHRSIYEGANV